MAKSGEMEQFFKGLASFVGVMDNSTNDDKLVWTATSEDAIPPMLNDAGRCLLRVAEINGETNSPMIKTHLDIYCPNGHVVRWYYEKLPGGYLDLTSNVSKEATVEARINCAGDTVNVGEKCGYLAMLKEMKPKLEQIHATKKAKTDEA